MNIHLKTRRKEAHPVPSRQEEIIELLIPKSQSYAYNLMLTG